MTVGVPVSEGDYGLRLRCFSHYYDGSRSVLLHVLFAELDKFTGKERDTESGLDEFGARYYGSRLGRFMTPDWAATPIDVPYANFGNPQSLNLYSYVKNNPTTTRDPDGHCCDDLLNFLGGVANAYGSDNLLGAGGTVTFKYDPFGRRAQKAFTQNGTTTTTNYLYDGPNILETTDQNGNVLARYVDTQAIDEPLSEMVSGTTGYYDQDGLGSVSSLSNSAGALANTYTYDSYGRLTASTGTLPNPFQYTGRESIRKPASTGIGRATTTKTLGVSSARIRLGSVAAARTSTATSRTTLLF